MIRGLSSTMMIGLSDRGKMAFAKALLTEGSVFQGPSLPCHYCYCGFLQSRCDAMKKR